MLNSFISITAIKGKRICYVGCYRDDKAVNRIIEDIPVFVGPGWKLDNINQIDKKVV